MKRPPLWIITISTKGNDTRVATINYSKSTSSIVIYPKNMVCKGQHACQTLRKIKLFLFYLSLKKMFNFRKMN